MLRGTRKPRLAEAGVLVQSKSAEAAERLLMELIEHSKASLIAIDAPLTLPPCLVCPSNCLGPDSEHCELRSSQLVWAEGGNPVTERLCEVQLRAEIGGGGPLPTMRIGQIAGRGVALARRLRAQRAERGAVGGPDLIEVYPAASLHRLGWTKRPTQKAGRPAQRRFRGRVLKALGGDIGGLGDLPQCRTDGHAFDALIAAYTGWLAPEGLDAPHGDFNAATGWIWVPRSS